MKNIEAESTNENTNIQTNDENVDVINDTDHKAETPVLEENPEILDDFFETSDTGNDASSENEAEQNKNAANENDAPEYYNEQEEFALSRTNKRKRGGSFFKSKKFIIPLCSILGAAAATYIGGVIFYSGHFLSNTHIGSYDCSNMTPEEARNSIQTDLDAYGFTFYESGDVQETISGTEIGFTNSPIGDLDSLKAQQNPFRWFYPEESTKDLPIEIEVSYNEDALYNRITEMNFMAASRESVQGKAQNIHFVDGAYTVTDDGVQNIVSMNDIFARVKPKIYELYKGMSLEKEGCYGGLANDDTIKGVINLLNQYAASKIVYSYSPSSRVLDASTFSNWITLGDDYSISINRDSITEYVDEIAMEFNTVGKARSFTTTGGSEITITDGDYGWIVNKKKEAEDIYNSITSGVTTEREPYYSQRAASHGSSDISDTYVEVSIGGQHMWYYKNGSLIVSSDIVSGNPDKGNGTPVGIYSIAYKAKDAVLRGEDYETPVSFWMPFNGGVGLHDAVWRGAFGGSIYRGGGSHGCVNLPFSVAQTLFANVSAGDPVVVY